MKLPLAALLLAAPLALAQPSPQPTCASPTTTAFDVASVKPSQIDPGSSRNNGSAASITASGTAFRMIQYAYDLHDFQLTGAPNWLSNATWDIVAKVDQPVPNWTGLRSDDRRAIQRQRMAAVLAQRFALKCHFESKQLPVYNLVLAKGGSKLQQTPADGKKGSFNWDGNGRENHMNGAGVELTALASMLSQSLGRTVIDKTGLAGLYDLKLTWSSQGGAGSSASADDAASGPTIFTALEEQLGLHLESAKGPVPVLVIDSIDRPSEN